MKFKVGQTYTLINHKDNYRNKGRVSFLRVNRVGRKYLYGKSIWKDGKKGWKDSYNEIRRTIDDFIWIEGFRGDLYVLYKQYEKDVREYNAGKDNVYRDIKYKYQKLQWAEQEQWREDNPYPECPTLKEGVI